MVLIESMTISTRISPTCKFLNMSICHPVVVLVSVTSEVFLQSCLATSPFAITRWISLLLGEDISAIVANLWRLLWRRVALGLLIARLDATVS